MKSTCFVLFLSLAASAGAFGADPTVLRYALWDASQIPQYQAVADAFHRAHPDIVIKFEQDGWPNYWPKLQTELVAGTAPDVFTDHLFYYPVFSANNQIVDIEPLVRRDHVPTGIYFPTLADLWTHNGKRYGLPKDWDTEALMYNTEMLKKAGISAREMNDLTWNPEDGGTFQKVIARLTLDGSGNNGLSPSFDKSSVSQYGFLASYVEGASAAGHPQWTSFAVSTGWWYTNAPVWGTHYNYDDQRLIKTIQWYADLSLKNGFSPAFADIPQTGPQSLLVSGKVACMVDGDWMIKWDVQNAKFKVGIAPLPVGPAGRKSMIDGLADSIWVGSKNQEAAWEWMKFMATPAAQETVGKYGVIYPAVPAGAQRSVDTQREQLGVNPQPFLNEAKTPGVTYPFLITEHGPQVDSIMRPALQAVFTGQQTAQDALVPANDQVNALFAQ